MYRCEYVHVCFVTCRVRTALVAHPTFGGAIGSMRGFFASIAADPPPAVAAALGLAAAGGAAPKAEPGKENAAGGGEGGAGKGSDVPLAPIFLAAKAQARSRAAAAAASMPPKAEPPAVKAEAAAGVAGVAGAPDCKAAVLQQAAQQQQQQQEQAAQQAARQEAAAAAAQRGQLARVMAALQQQHLPGWVYNDVKEYAAHLRSRGAPAAVLCFSWGRRDSNAFLAQQQQLGQGQGQTLGCLTGPPPSSSSSSSSAGIGPGSARLEAPAAHPVTTVEHLAAAAVMDAFALARECWAAAQPMAFLFTSRTVPPPRGLQAVLAASVPPQTLPGLDLAVMEWGALHLHGFPLPLALEAMETQYQAEAQCLHAGQPTQPQQQPQQQYPPPHQQQQQERSGTGSREQPWQQQQYPQQQQQAGHAQDGSTRKRVPSDAHSSGAGLYDCSEPPAMRAYLQPQSLIPTFPACAAYGSAAKRCLRSEPEAGGLTAAQHAAVVAAAISEDDVDDSQW